MKPFFSIVVPIYNVERFLHDCFDSIYCQSFNDFEVIAVNDGSTDSSEVICLNYKKKYSNFKLISKENGGLSDARNVGIDNSEGKYIIFLDADDMLTDKALLSLSKIIERQGDVDIILNRIINFTDEIQKECAYSFSSELYNLSTVDKYKAVMKQKGYLPGAWTIVINAEYLRTKKLYFVKGLLHEDEQWMPRAFLNAKKIAFNNEPYYMYRCARIGSITQTKSLKRELDKLWTVKSLYKESESNNYNLEEKLALIERSAHIYWGLLINAPLYKNNYEDYLKLLKELEVNKKIFELSKKNKYRFFNKLIDFCGIKFVCQSLHFALRVKKLTNYVTRFVQ